MPVANHEGSLVSIPGLSGFFTHTLDGTLNYGAAYPNTPNSASGIILAQAIQSVSITQNVNAEPLPVIGHVGHAGWGKRAGTVDVQIEAVLTSGYPLGKRLTDYEADIPGNLTLDTTDGQTLNAVGRRALVSGMAITSIAFNFAQNANSTLSVGLIGEGTTWFPLTSPVGMDIDIEHAPLTWDTVDLSCPVAGLIRLSGIQTATFSATLNRDQIFEVGTFDAIDKPVTHPNNVSVSLEALANSVVIQSWLDKFVSNFDVTNSANLVTAKVRRQGNATADWIVASGLHPTAATLNAATGSNSMLSLSFTGTSLEF